jgi:negative regulator of replication initiation
VIILKRTQIYLDEEIYKYLVEESKKTGKSISELIREKLRKEINENAQRLIENIRKTSGIWKNRNFDTENYIRNLRKGNRIDSI